MATSFIGAGDQTWYEDAADTWFETFKKSITVNKEPIKNELIKINFIIDLTIY